MAYKNYFHKAITKVVKSLVLAGSNRDGSGPELTRQDDNTINVPGLAIAGTTVASGEAFDRLKKVAKVALGTATGNAGLFSWQNPEASKILVTRTVMHLTSEATGAANADVGTDGDGTGTSDNLLDGVDIGSAAGVFDNIGNTGTNGKNVVVLDEKGGTTDYITGTASADPAGLVGNVYIEYVLV